MSNLSREHRDRTGDLQADDACIQALFAEQVERTPDAVAVVFASASLTYAELYARANRLAWYLREIGVGPEVRVGICLERSLELVVAILAVLGAGGAYVPLDPSYPAARLRFMAEDADARVVLGTSALDIEWPRTALRLDLDTLDERLATLRAEPPPRLTRADHLAYVIYTSGSTGAPKGVAVAHRGIVNLVVDEAERVGITPGTAVLHFSSFGFDASVSQLFGPLIRGARLFVATDEQRHSPQAMMMLLRDEAIEIADIPPGALALLEPDQLQALRVLIVGGEACPPVQAQRFARGRRLINAYGPTEATITATYWEGAVTGGELPIGRPCANMRALVLDAELQRAEIGVRGELYLAGVGLARGYLGRPGLTAERFVPDPFGPPGSRMYRTGDACRWRADGQLELLGRIDQQVKIRGFRIELGEIEAALGGHPAVRQCVVLHRNDAGDARLVAYLAGAPAPVAELRAHLERTLPGHMVPSAFMWLEALPLTPNGKVDRKALPAPDVDRAALSVDFAAPRTPTETTLAGIWADVLGLDAVGVYDNFLELGGDSILSIQVIGRAARAGLRLTPRQLFERPTVAGLAEVAVPSVAPPAADQRSIEGEAPASPIQRWFVAERFAQAHHWNQAVSLAITPLWTPMVLAAGLRAVVEQHDALRLGFEGERGWHGPLPERVPVRTLELAATARERRDAAIAAVATELQASMRLTDPPLLRALRVDRGDEGVFLVLAIHHLVVDAVSWRILLDDLARACDAIIVGKAVDLGPKSSSWQRWVLTQRALVRDGALAEDRRYWEQLVAAPVATLPTLPPSSSSPTIRGVVVALDPEQTELLLRGASRAYRTRINDLLLAALAMALGRWTGHHTVGVLLEGHGREEALVGGLDVSRTIGWFTTMFPVRIELPGGGELGQVIKATKEHLRGIPNEGASYGMLRWLGDGGDALALPEGGYEVVFNYLSQQRREAGGFFAEVGPTGESIGRSNHLPTRVEINGAVVDDTLQVRVDYDARWFADGSVEGLAEHFIASLRAIIEHCTGQGAGSLTPSDVPLSGLDQAALDQLQAQHPGLEDVYPATPMQAGMLFHALHEPGSWAYFEQLCFELRDEVDELAFERAFAEVVARHAALRTALVWEGLARPLQVVLAAAPVPSLRVELEAGTALDAWLKADRTRGFALDDAPLMRLAWLRAGDRRHLVWSSHHVLFDGWSMPVVLDEALRLYVARRRGTPLALPKVSPYRDYVAWLAAQDHEAGLAYWREQFADLREPFRLALPYPDAVEREQGEHRVSFDAELSARMRTFTRSHGLTLNTLLQGAWALMLARNSGRDDVCFGVAVSGRPPTLAGVETMVGLFINTLPLRVRVRGDVDVLAWLTALQREQVIAREHQTTPLAEVQRCAGTPPGAPLFDTLLVFESYPQSTHEVELELGKMSAFEQTNYELTAAVLPGDALEVLLTWPRERFDGDTIERLAGQLRQALTAMIEAPARRLRDIEISTAAQRRQVLALWNDTQRPYPDGACVHDLFAEQVARTSDAVALVFAGTPLTYAELHARANRLAHHLRALGVAPELRVGICLERSLELVVAILAVLGAGAAYVPMEPGYPAERLRFMAEDAELRVLITDSRLTNPWPESVRRLDLDTLGDSLAGLPDQAPPSRTEPENLAYVIYTSGSTGRPKGVGVPHRSAVNLVVHESVLLGVSAGRPVLHFSSFAFDASVSQLFSTLIRGGRLVLASADECRSPVALTSLLARERVEIAVLPVSALSLVDTDVLPDLRVLMVGGEVCALKTAAAHARERRFINAYGPTETTVAATYWEATAPLPALASLPLGRPGANTRVYVLDDQLDPVPIGVPGELYIAGLGVARGYLERPGLTAERFVPDPFGPPGGRMYGSGDLCRWRSDGNLEFLGRLDHQVKIRGIRIELGEIEATLGRHPAVRRCAVVARNDSPSGARLVAYLVGEPRSVAELRAHLAATLPDAMVPSFFVWLDDLPLTPGGKLDRRALPAPDVDHAALSVDFVAPRTPTEATLASIWAEVLGLASVGVHANFFELGGDSISSIRVISRATRAGIPLTSRQLFEHPTIVGLAEVLAPAIASPETLTRAIGEHAPLSFAQARIWMLARREQFSVGHVTGLALRLRGPLDRPVLLAALELLVSRHEALRTAIVEVDGELRQRIMPPTWIEPNIEDLSLLAPHAREAALQARLGEDLGRLGEPLTRIHLLTLGPEHTALVINVHHALADGWSMGVLADELRTSYASLAAGQRTDLPPLPIRFAEYAAWEREHLAGPTLARQLDHWRERLRGVARLDLPTDHPRPVQLGDRGAVVPLPPLTVTDALHALARAHDTTAFNVLLAIWQLLLARLSGQSDIVVGTVVANRERWQIEHVIGCFINLVPLRTDLSGDLTFARLLARTKATTLAAFEHQSTPFEAILDALEVPREPNRRPLVSALFMLQNAPGTQQIDRSFAPGLATEALEAPDQVSRFDLGLSLRLTPAGLRGFVRYSTELFEPSTAERIARMYASLLALVIAHPDQPLTLVAEISSS
jgi:amino acid adenylation domain-containing protein/non-ribosomal peptide synthase protein (TIGR01720 family)